MPFNGKFPPGLFPRDLISEWRFHPSEPLADSRNSNDLTNTNAAVIGTVNLHDGYYATFDGATADGPLLNAGSGSNLDDLGPVSYDFWFFEVSIGGNNAGRFFDKGNTNLVSSGRDWIFTIAGSTALIRTMGATTYTQSAWHHGAVTYSGVFTAATSIRFYVDGLETTYASGQDGDTRTSDAAGSFLIGNRSAADRTFNGSIGPFRIWNKVLTPEQVGWIYQRYK